MPFPNDLWRKDGGPPIPLPPRDTDEHGEVWTDFANRPDSRAACGYTKAPDYPNDYNPATKDAFWDGEAEAWVIVDKPVVPTDTTVRITHKQLLDLMTQAEQVIMRIKRKELDALTPTEYAASTSWQAFSLLLDAFDKSQMIELSNPQTIYGFNNILVPMGVFTSARATRILSNQPPEVESD